ncbi:hypothetical protein BLGI_1095 [Brevibacillus laterosporus GI-9]|nr:hypothetical protein BLGI_1095 [Brevibacillus laterosporus GI-9]
MAGIQLTIFTHSKLTKLMKRCNSHLEKRLFIPTGMVSSIENIRGVFAF